MDLSCSLRYPLRIEAMQTKLEFADKLADLRPAIETLKLGLQGLNMALEELH